MYTLSSEESSHDGLLLPVDTEVRNCGRSRPEEVTMSKNDMHDTTTAGRATCVEALNVDMEVDCDYCCLFLLFVCLFVCFVGDKRSREMVRNKKRKSQLQRTHILLLKKKEKKKKKKNLRLFVL